MIFLFYFFEVNNTQDHYWKEKIALWYDGREERREDGKNNVITHK